LKGGTKRGGRKKADTSRASVLKKNDRDKMMRFDIYIIRGEGK
jgi:hypothetical protein